MKTVQSSILAATLLSAAIAQSIQAEVLVSIPFNENNGNVVQNLGSLPDATLARSDRPTPRLVSPGVGGNGFAVQLTNEQTGRPGQWQAVQIESEGLNQLSEWTLALWFKADATVFNNNNPVGKDLKTTLFATSSNDSVKSDAGIRIGLHGAADGTAQIFVKLGDGSNGAQGYFNFTPRPNARDGQWTFLAITFDANKLSNKLGIYGGDETKAVKKTYSDNRHDSVTGTGVALDSLISIGDGLDGYGPFSSLNGQIDQIYLSSEAMSLEQIEAVRAAALQ